jgi:hypothetical protein
MPWVIRRAREKNKEEIMRNQVQTGTPVWQLALAWAWVGIPLTLGVIQTIINSLKLFQ